MDVLYAIILAIVEGITEFLPVSSTGHLVLASALLNISQTDFIKSFEIIIQLGAVLAIVNLYWQTFINVKNIETWKRILVAFIPTAVIGYALYHFIKSYLLGNTAVTLWALLIGGIILILVELFYKEKEHHIDDIAKLSLLNAFLIGVVQSLSVIPGVSRSAATIIGGMFLGLKRKTAVEFSFLLAVPTMIAASGLDVVKSSFSFTMHEWILLVVGFTGSFIVAHFTVKYFLAYIQKHTFIPFGVYRILLAIAFYLFLVR